MAPDRKYGRTDFAPVNILPEVALEFPEARADHSTLGRTEAPVHILPELTFDLEPTVPMPVLQLRRSFRPDAPTNAVALDLFRLYRAVNDLELSLSGSGLTPDADSGAVVPLDTTICVTFRPTNPEGADDRLTKLVAAVNDPQTFRSNIHTTFPSSADCEAAIVRAA